MEDLREEILELPLDERERKGFEDACAVMKKYIEIAGIKKTKIYNEKISIRNRNHLIGENGVYGIKTGFHKEAKYNIAVASKFQDTDVVLAAKQPHGNDHAQEAAVKRHAAFPNFKHFERMFEVV